MITIPGTIFSDLVNLVWLDLRNNQLTSLPPQIGQAPKLKELLLAGNVLRELPVELARVKTLRGLQLQVSLIFYELKLTLFSQTQY